MMTQVISQPNITSLIHLSSLDNTPCHSPNSSFDAQDSFIMDAEAQGVNRKLKRLAMDSRTSTKRQSYHPDHPEHFEDKKKNDATSSQYYSVDEPSMIANHMRITPLSDHENARFRRMEEMSHFHYTNVDLDGNVKVALCDAESEELLTLDTGQPLLISVKCKEKAWVIKRSHDDFVGLDRQIHRCLYGRNFSKLPTLSYFDTPITLTSSMVRQMQFYLSRFAQVTGDNMTCGPILNWLELDNHGNHLVVMEADDSAINVPAVAAGRVIKRYQAQAPDEMSLEVGDFLSVIDMPPVDETVWWRGKKGFEVGFFPSHCVEILSDKLGINEKLAAHFAVPSSNPKSRGKFISFLRFFFKSRPSKDDIANGVKNDRVFGCDLGELLAYTGHDVPLVISMCAEIIEEHGIVDGIYRLSGITSNLQRLKHSFDNDESPPDLRDTKYLNDIHCISSLMKTYFRELPNPLFTHELYDKFVMAVNKDDDSEKTVAFHHVIQRLPPPHYRTMNKLFRHLNFCASHADKTNMTAKNLSIVWAPNLLRPHLQDSITALAGFRTQAIIVEYMIRNVDVFFDTNLASAAIAYYPEVQDQSNITSDILNTNRVNTMSVAPRLISLEEARKRVSSAAVTNNSTTIDRKVSDTQSIESASSNSPRHSKLRSSSRLPPQVAANPVSPLPSLLSLEEAQARSKNKFHLPRRGSADLIEMRNDKPMNSPKRTRKWFGLFTRTKSPETIEGMRGGSVGEYRKTNRTDISGPIRSHSDFQLQNLKNKVSQRDSTSTWFIQTPPVTAGSDNDSDGVLEMGKKSDQEDDLLSAVVAVSAKYMKSKHRRSFTIGEPSEYRKIADSALSVSPPTSLEIPQTQRNENDSSITSSDVKQKTGVSPAREKFIQTSNTFFQRRSMESIQVANQQPESMQITNQHQDLSRTINQRPELIPITKQQSEPMLIINRKPENIHATNKKSFECSSPMDMSQSNEYIQDILTNQDDVIKNENFDFRNKSDGENKDMLTSAERKHVLNKSGSTENILPVKRVRSLSPDTYSNESGKFTSTESLPKSPDRKFQLVASPSFKEKDTVSRYNSEVSRNAAKELGKVLLSRPLSVDSSSTTSTVDTQQPILRMNSESAMRQPKTHRNYVNEVITDVVRSTVCLTTPEKNISIKKHDFPPTRERSHSQDSCSDKLVHRTEFQLSSKSSDLPTRDYDIAANEYSSPFITNRKMSKKSQVASRASMPPINADMIFQQHRDTKSFSEYNKDYSKQDKLYSNEKSNKRTSGHVTTQPVSRPRNLSVKEKSAIFNDQISQPNLTNSPDVKRTVNLRTKSHPNLYLRTEFSSRQSPSRTLNVSSPEKDHIKKYTSEFNKRHTYYENNSIFDSDENLRHEAKTPSKIIERNYSEEALRPKNNAPNRIYQRHSDDILYARNSPKRNRDGFVNTNDKPRPKSAAYPRDGLVSRNMDLFNRKSLPQSPMTSPREATLTTSTSQEVMTRHPSASDYRPADLSYSKPRLDEIQRTTSPRNLRSVSHELLSAQNPRSSSSTNHRSFSDESLSKNISNLNSVMNKVDERVNQQLNKYTADDSGDELVRSTYARNQNAFTNRPKSEYVTSNHPFNRLRTRSNYENIRSQSPHRKSEDRPLPESQHRLQGPSQYSNDVRSSDVKKQYHEGYNRNPSRSNVWHEDRFGRRIGNFPLTLYSGNDIDKSRVQSGKINPALRPVSLYDNIRKSQYDNVEEIHYEML